MGRCIRGCAHHHPRRPREAVSPGSGDAGAVGRTYSPGVDRVERLLRLLSVNNEESLERALAGQSADQLPSALSPKVDLLVRLGALLALGAPIAPLRAIVERALAAGATEDEIADVLVTVAPTVGLARVVSSAPRLAIALGYDIADDDE